MWICHKGCGYCQFNKGWMSEWVKLFNGRLNTYSKICCPTGSWPILWCIFFSANSPVVSPRVATISVHKKISMTTTPNWSTLIYTWLQETHISIALPLLSKTVVNIWEKFKFKFDIGHSCDWVLRFMKKFGTREKVQMTKKFRESRSS